MRKEDASDIASNDVVVGSKRSQYLWHESFARPGESLWSLIQKFMLINKLTHSEMRQLFVKKEAVRYTYEELTNWSCLDSSMVGKHLDLDPNVLAQAVDDYYFLPDEGQSVARSKQELRYCPECIKHAFHSPLFQQYWLKQCPLHRVDLMSRCPSCNIELMAETKGNGFPGPFKCSQGHWIAPNLDESPNWRDLETDKLLEFSHGLNRAIGQFKHSQNIRIRNLGSYDEVLQVWMPLLGVPKAWAKLVVGQGYIHCLMDHEREPWEGSEPTRERYTSWSTYRYLLAEEFLSFDQRLSEIGSAHGESSCGMASDAFAIQNDCLEVNKGEVCLIHLAIAFWQERWLPSSQGRVGPEIVHFIDWLQDSVRIITGQPVTTWMMNAGFLRVLMRLFAARTFNDCHRHVSGEFQELAPERHRHWVYVGFLAEVSSRSRKRPPGHLWYRPSEFDWDDECSIVDTVKTHLSIPRAGTVFQSQEPPSFTRTGTLDWILS